MCPLLYEWGHGSESQSAGWEELERNLGFVWEKLAVSMLVSQTPVTDSKLKWTFYLQQEARVAASQAEQTQLLAKPAQPYLWLLHGHTGNLWELEFFNSVTSKSVWIFKVKCFFFTPLKWNYHKIWIIFLYCRIKKSLNQMIISIYHAGGLWMGLRFHWIWTDTPWWLVPWW